MAATRRAQRTTSQLPPCYYEGFLEKRSFKDKIGRKFWASLCGNDLFFYNNNKDNDYVEKLELSTLITLTDDFSHDRRLDAARFHLHLKGQDIYLTAPSLETRELWKGFILSVVKLVVPTALNLLPGQICMLKEAVDKEIERLKEYMKKSVPANASITLATKGPGNYMSVLSEMPACFYRVPREEAQVLLEKNKEKGNLLLRPSRHGCSFAVTTRQEFNGPVFRHYRVNRIPDGGFAIELENPISCTSLHDVITYLMKKTDGVFKPLLLEHTYEESIEYVLDDEENGEKSVCCASNSPVASKTPPKPLPRSKYCDPEAVYLNPDEEDALPIVEPRKPAKPLVHQESTPDLLIGQNGALLPPTSRPRSVSETPANYKLSRSAPPTAVRCHNEEDAPQTVVPRNPDFTAELKKIFKQRAVSE